MSSIEANNGDDWTLQSAQELPNSSFYWSYTITPIPRGQPAGAYNQTPSSQRRASKAAIEAMPKVTVAYEEEGTECSICLNGLKVGDEVKEMPCKHRFHGACIERWMGMSTFCPLCKFSLPAESEDEHNSAYVNNDSSIFDPSDIEYDSSSDTEYDSSSTDTEYDSESEEDTGSEWGDTS